MQVVDDHQPGKDAPAISHHHTESNSLVMDSPEKSTEKTITEGNSSNIIVNAYFFLVSQLNHPLSACGAQDLNEPAQW